MVELLKESFESDIRFSQTSELDVLEIFRYPSLAKPEWIKSTVGDSTLSEWFENVRTLQQISLHL